MYICFFFSNRKTSRSRCNIIQVKILKYIGEFMAYFHDLQIPRCFIDFDSGTSTSPRVCVHWGWFVRRAVWTYGNCCWREYHSNGIINFAFTCMYRYLHKAYLITSAKPESEESPSNRVDLLTKHRPEVDFHDPNHDPKLKENPHNYVFKKKDTSDTEEHINTKVGVHLRS